MTPYSLTDNAPTPYCTLQGFFKISGNLTIVKLSVLKETLLGKKASQQTGGTIKYEFCGMYPEKKKTLGRITPHFSVVLFEN